MVNLDQYVVATGLIIVIVAWMVGPGGAAPTLLPEKDVGPNGTDFNTSRLSFQPEFPEPPVYDSQGLSSDEVISNSSVDFNNSKVYWDGTTNDRGENYGYIVFNVSNRTDTIVLDGYDATGFFGANGYEYYATNADNETFLLLEDTQDLGGGEFSSNYIKFEIRILDVDSYVDVAGQEASPETGFFDSVVNFIQFGYRSITGIFGLLGSYVAFALLLPAGIGYIALGFLGVMIAYLLLKEGWIG